MKVDIYDTQGRHYELWVDDWSEYKGSYIFYKNGKITAIYNKENVIGIEFKERG